MFENEDVLLFIDPKAQAQFSRALSKVERHEHSEELINGHLQSDDDFWPDPESWKAQFRPYNVRDGILQIPVRGVLLNDFGWQFGSWATGYDYIRRAWDRGMDDSRVRGIALVTNSGGGTADGNFDLVDHMWDSRRKPVRAFANARALSGAYSIVTVADQIIMSRTGAVGSVGVVTAHIDISKMDERHGVKVTYIFAGRHKVDGNPHEPLPDNVKARMQERIDETYNDFVAIVARNRGELSEEQVRDSEADIFSAREATSNGFADDIGVLDDAVAAFAVDCAQSEEDAMSGDKKGSSADNQAAVDEARAEGFKAGKAEGLEEGKALGTSDERGRISAIMKLDSAEKRQKSALTIALTSGSTVEQADELLKGLPEEVSESNGKGESHFKKAMAEGNPELGAGEGDDDDEDRDDGADIKAAYSKATGYDFSAKK